MKIPRFHGKKWRKTGENSLTSNMRHGSGTCFNKEKGVRYCVWLAPSEDVLKSIFSELEISWATMLEVEETCPDRWGKKWEEHLAAEAKADTLAFWWIRLNLPYPRLGITGLSRHSWMNSYSLWRDFFEFNSRQIINLPIAWFFNLKLELSNFFSLPSHPS